MKGGRKRVSDILLTKTVFDSFRGAQPAFFMDFVASKHCLGHFWAPPFMTRMGYGARYNLKEMVFSNAAYFPGLTLMADDKPADLLEEVTAGLQAQMPKVLSGRGDRVVASIPFGVE